MSVARTEERGFIPIVCMLLTWALLSGLSYPHANVWGLAHVSLVPLTLLALQGGRTRRVVGCTYVAASLWWAGMMYWLIPVTGLGYIALSGFLGGYAALYVFCLRMIYRKVNPPLAVAVPVVWVGLEWMRGAWVLTGFPWFTQGQSQPTWFIQIADVMGMYGVSFLVCMSNGLLCDLLTRPLVKRRVGGRLDLTHGVFASVVLWVLMVGGGAGYGIYRSGQEVARPEDGAALRVAVVQSNVPQSNKQFPTEAQDEANFARMMSLSEQAAADKPDLVIWPETMVPDALDEESASLFEGSRDKQERLTDWARRHETPMIVGAHAMVGWRESGPYLVPSRRYNSAFLVTAEGVQKRYDKVHRVPFGEYLPLVEGWDWGRRMLLKLTPYDHDYTLTPGHALEIFEVKGWRLATPICFEDVVTYLPRKMVYKDGRKRADLLVNMSNDGWFAGTVEAWQHEQIARFRCVENRVPMVRAVNTGISGFMDSTGRVMGRVEGDGGFQEIDGTLTLEVYKDPRKAWYSVWGDGLAIGCLLLTAFGTLWGWLMGRARQKRGPKMADGI